MKNKWFPYWQCLLNSEMFVLIMIGCLTFGQKMRCWIEIFMSVYHQKSITKAAKELHISQPSVSLAIKELEEKYQTILFDRMNRQIYPTEKACLLYNHSMQIHL